MSTESVTGLKNRIKTEEGFRKGDDERIVRAIVSKDVDDEEREDLLRVTESVLENFQYHHSTVPVGMRSFPSQLEDHVDDLLALPNIVWPIVGRTGETDRAATTTLVERLVQTFKQDDSELRRSASFAIHLIAIPNADLLRPSVTTLRPALSDPDDDVRDHMCHSFKLIAEADVTAVFPVYEDIVQCLDDRESIVRGGAVWVLRWVAEEYPERVFDHIARVVELMEDEESWTRHGAAWAVAFLADADPDRVEPYVPAVIALLEGYVYREDEYKFSNAGPNELLFDAPIEVLRLVGRSQPEAVADAVPLLDEIASNDEYDQEIRTFAADTVEDIE